MPFSLPFLGFALDDDDASCSTGTTSKEVELEPASTKVGVLLPLPPVEIEDAKDAPSATLLKEGRALNDDVFIVVGSGEIIFFDCCAVVFFMSVLVVFFYERTRQSWQGKKN